MNAAPGGRRAVLFDLDGTLIDSAPDLAGAANEMRLARGLEPLPFARLRPMVGAGARGVLARAFEIGPEAAAFPALRSEFLDRYEARMTRETTVFEEMRPVLAALAADDRPWGIVTNKVARFAEPLVRALRLLPEDGVLVCGDTTPHAKPHPAPLLEAARRLAVAVAECVYVGDDHRDVRAGRAAGMATAVAGWGYLGDGDPVQTWGADRISETPAALLHWLRMP